jgi:hypothetical protein
MPEVIGKLDGVEIREGYDEPNNHATAKPKGLFEQAGVEPSGYERHDIPHDSDLAASDCRAFRAFGFLVVFLCVAKLIIAMLCR